MPDRAQGVGATLIHRAGVAVAHRTRHRLQPLVEGVGVGGQQPRLDVGGPRTVFGFADIGIAAARGSSVRRTAAGS